MGTRDDLRDDVAWEPEWFENYTCGECEHFEDNCCDVYTQVEHSDAIACQYFDMNEEVRILWDLEQN